MAACGCWTSGCTGQCSGGGCAYRWCGGGCTGCGAACASSCTSCDGGCEGCDTTCNTGCKGNCKGACNVGCTSKEATELRTNLALLEYIEAENINDIARLIELEVSRRNKTPEQINCLKSQILTNEDLIHITNNLDKIGFSSNYKINKNEIVSRQAWLDFIKKGIAAYDELVGKN